MTIRDPPARSPGSRHRAPAPGPRPNDANRSARRVPRTCHTPGRPGSTTVTHGDSPALTWTTVPAGQLATLARREQELGDKVNVVEGEVRADWVVNPLECLNDRGRDVADAAARIPEEAMPHAAEPTVTVAG